MWSSRTLFALTCAAAVLGIATSQQVQYVAEYGPTLDLIVDNALIVTLAPCTKVISINASSSILYSNNALYLSNGFFIPGVTQFYSHLRTGFSPVSDGGQILSVPGKLYAQVPRALFIASSVGLVGAIDGRISSFVPQVEPVFTASVQGTYITIQNVPLSYQLGSTSVKGTPYTFGPFNTMTFINDGSNFTNNVTTRLYTVNAIAPNGSFACIDAQSLFNGPGVILGDTQSARKLFVNFQKLIDQINDAYTGFIVNTFQFRYTDVAGTGKAYLTSGGADLTQLTGAMYDSFPDSTSVSFQNDVVAFAGAGTPTYTFIGYLSIFDGLKGLEARIRGGPSLIQRSFSTTPGTLIFGTNVLDVNTLFYTTSNRLLDYISGDTNIIFTVTGTRVSVRRGNLTIVDTNTISSSNVPSQAQLSYTGNTLTGPGGLVLNGIKQLAVLSNKALTSSFQPDSTVTLYGPGLLLYSRNAAFYTTDQILQDQFSSRVSSVLARSLGFEITSPSGTANLITSNTNGAVSTLLSPVTGGVPFDRVPLEATTVSFNGTTVTFSPGGLSLQSVTDFSVLDGTSGNVVVPPKDSQYPISGGGAVYAGGSKVFYSTSAQLDSFLSPPYTVSQSLTGASLTVQRGASPLVTSSTVRSLPTGTSVVYNNDAVTTTLPDSTVFTATPVRTLTTFNSNRLTPLQQSSTPQVSSGPGFLVYNISTGDAYYTTDNAQVNAITSTYQQTLSNTFGLTYTTTPSGSTALTLSSGGVNLLQTTGATAYLPDPSIVQVTYQGDTLTTMSRDGAIVSAISGINTVSYFIGPKIVTLYGPGSGQAIPVQGGQAFISQDKVFYTNSQQVIDYISSLPGTVYAVNGNQLVVTNRDSPVGTFSQLYNVPMGGQLSYNSAGQLSFTTPMTMGLPATTTVLSTTYTNLTTFDGTKLSTVVSPSTLPGGGQLYYDQAQQQAHYLTSPALITILNNLYQDVYGKMFTFGYNSVRGTTQTTLATAGTRNSNGQIVGRENIVQLGAKTPTSIPSSANSITFQNNQVTFGGPDSTYPSFPATSLFVYNNTLSSFKLQNATTPILGGGTVYTDGSSVFYTAHQQVSGYLTSGLTNAPIPSSTYFRVATDSDTGVASLLADGLNVITLTGSASQSVPYGSYITYTDGTVTVRSSTGQTLLTVPNQSQLTVADTNGVKTTVYQGSFPSTLPKLQVTTLAGGRLYTNGPQSFFTTDSAVLSTVNGAIQNPYTPSFQVVVKNATTTTNGVLTLTAGPNQRTLFPLTNAQSFSTSGSILYNNNTFSILAPGTVLSGNPTYSTNSITFGGTKVLPVTSLMVYDGVNLNDVTSGTPVALSPGGTLYQSPTGNSLYINPSVTNIPSNVANELLQRSTVLYSQGNVSSLQVFDGRQLLPFKQSAPYLISGVGTYYINGDQVFFTSSPGLLRTITTQSSQLSTYGLSSVEPGRFTISVNGVPQFETLTGAKVIPLQAGDTVSYNSGIIRNKTSILQGLPIAASTLTVDTGFATTTYNSSAQFPLSGPGLLIVNVPSQVGGGPGDAFLSLSPSLTALLGNAQNLLTGSYRPPVIATPSSPLFASHYKQVYPNYSTPQFGQEIRVFESADVLIRCDTGGFPSPTVTFSKWNGTDWVDLPSSSTTYIGGIAYLNISGVTLQSSGAYRCTAQNVVGTASQQSVLKVAPAVSPSVGTPFLLNKIQPGQQVIQVANLDHGGPIPVVQVALNTVSQYSVNCKSMGRPRADISWNVNNPNIAVVNPKPGTSYLNVSVSDNTIPSCITYNCTAENVASQSPSVGGVTVCTRRYFCNSTSVFTPCSVTCGLAGVRTEILACKVITSNSEVAIDYKDIPSGYVQTVPQVILGCGQGDCPVTTYQYEVSNFSSCSATCGGGYQTRNASCVQLMSRIGSPTNKTVVSNTLCLIAGKSLNVSLVGVCNTQACPTYVVGNYGACSVQCGTGIRTRSVQCTDINKVVYNDSACLGQVRPTDTSTCQQPPCPYAWTYTAWGPCTPDCFVGTQTRTVFCVDVRNPSVSVNSSLCTGVKPTDTNRCGSGPCPSVGLWLTSAFSACVPNNGSCGDGAQTRNVTCVDINNLSAPSIYCNPDTKPLTSQYCFTQCSSCTSEPLFCLAVPKMFCPQVSGICCKSCPPIVG